MVNTLVNIVDGAKMTILYPALHFRSHSPFACFFKEYSVADFEIGWCVVCHLLGMFESIFNQALLSYGKCNAV